MALFLIIVTNANAQDKSYANRLIEISAITEELAVPEIKQRLESLGQPESLILGGTSREEGDAWWTLAMKGSSTCRITILTQSLGRTRNLKPTVRVLPDCK